MKVKADVWTIDESTVAEMLSPSLISLFLPTVLIYVTLTVDQLLRCNSRNLPLRRTHTHLQSSLRMWSKPVGFFSINNRQLVLSMNSMCFHVMSSLWYSSWIDQKWKMWTYNHSSHRDLFLLCHCHQISLPPTSLLSFHLPYTPKQ